MDNTDKIIKQGFEEIDKEVTQEDEIKEKAKYIAGLLQKNPSATIEFNNDVYNIAMRQNYGYIILMTMSESIKRRAKIMNKMATPGMYKAEYNDEFTYEENLAAVVESFLLNVVGKIKIESQDDGIARVAREKDFK